MNERIKQIRKSNDLTQQEFAERLGCSRSTMANYEAGRNEPIGPVIAAICREFRVNEYWLRTGEGPMQQELTHKERLAAFFGDVLATAPDDRSAFLAALEPLPPECYSVLAKLARAYTAELTGEAEKKG